MKTEPVKTAGVVCFNKNKVLLLKPGQESKHNPDVYGLPAGRVEAGESYIQAALRELEEESAILLEARDLTALPETYQANLERKDGSHIFMIWQVYAAKDVNQQGEPTPEGEPVWVDIEDIETLNLQSNVLSAVKQAIKILNIKF